MDLTSNPPPRSTILTSQHWFLGVLCAPLEWPCRALSFHHLGAGCMHPAAPRSSCACPHSLPFIIVPLDDPLLPSHHPGSNFHPFFQSNLSTSHSNLFGFRFFTRAHTCSGSPPPPWLPLPSKLNWHSPHTPPGLVPPPSTPSKSNFRGKPCQNRHTFENFSKIFNF